MREIKFRGKDILNGEWIKGYLFYDYNNADEYRPFIIYKSEAFLGGVNEQQINENTIGQYTGLKDKNGKEIYEGDILKLHYIKNGLTEIKARVVYSDDYAQYVIKDTKYVSDDYEPLCDYEDLEVIGNIYENPELLKE